MMPRNLKYPVEHSIRLSLRACWCACAIEVLKTYVADEASARRMRSDGSYTPKSADTKFESQGWFLSQHVSRG
jgi:polyphosphate kinase